MLEQLLGSFIDKEQATSDTIKSTFEGIAEELNCNYNEMFIVIQPIDEKFNIKFNIYHKIANTAPKFIREITLKEILEN